ncbi:hypothetical protein L3X38_017089 [Prunus dulcis]|uniref:Uncharacterized protein n=1 Tax=Prunus dulcis TaxID=3755 RepID=A0AAD4W6M6_PRUDU|nr:hypothetical protein L3X38_017089 [Prunus dulcis]
MWDFVQVAVMVTRALEIRFGSWELRQSGASACVGTSVEYLPSAGEKALGAVWHSLVLQVGKLEVALTFERASVKGCSWSWAFNASGLSHYFSMGPKLLRQGTKIGLAMALGSFGKTLWAIGSVRSQVFLQELGCLRQELGCKKSFDEAFVKPCTCAPQLLPFGKGPLENFGPSSLSLASVRSWHRGWGDCARSRSAARISTGSTQPLPFGKGGLGGFGKVSARTCLDEGRDFWKVVPLKLGRAGLSLSIGRSSLEEIFWGRPSRVVWIS